MPPNRRQLQLRAIREATRLRAQLSLEASDTLCPYDVALRIGLAVQFMAAPSLEGVYNADEPQTIIIGSQRPAGRRRFTCGHEIGHHVFGHGTRFDQLDSTAEDSEEEYLANSFSAALLMPKTVVDAALLRRGWTHEPLTGEMVFTISQDLGVGYTTLVNHMSIVLRYVTFGQKATLEARDLRAIRKTIAGFGVPRDVFPVDDGWGSRPVDVDTGDVLILPEGARLAGDSVLREIEFPRWHILAAHAGITKLRLASGRELEVRVSREDYTGRAQYRHLDEPDDND